MNIESEPRRYETARFIYKEGFACLIHITQGSN
nr:MAG TPA: hypothetical protein [Caudoviricetes sp.]